jgi:hypothetical protein
MVYLRFRKIQVLQTACRHQNWYGGVVQTDMAHIQQPSGTDIYGSQSTT